MFLVPSRCPGRAPTASTSAVSLGGRKPPASGWLPPGKSTSEGSIRRLMARPRNEPKPNVSRKESDRKGSRGGQAPVPRTLLSCVLLLYLRVDDPWAETLTGVLGSVKRLGPAHAASASAVSQGVRDRSAIGDSHLGMRTLRGPPPLRLGTGAAQGSEPVGIAFLQPTLGMPNIPPLLHLRTWGTCRSAPYRLSTTRAAW